MFAETAKTYWIVDPETGRAINSVQLEDANVQEFIEVTEAQGFFLADGYEEEAA